MKIAIILCSCLVVLVCAGQASSAQIGLENLPENLNVQPAVADDLEAAEDGHHGGHYGGGHHGGHYGGGHGGHYGGGHGGHYGGGHGGHYGGGHGGHYGGGHGGHYGGHW